MSLSPDEIRRTLEAAVEAALDRLDIAIDAAGAEVLETHSASDQIQAECDRLARLADEEAAHARR